MSSTIAQTMLFCLCFLLRTENFHCTETEKAEMFPPVVKEMEEPPETTTTTASNIVDSNVSGGSANEDEEKLGPRDCAEILDDFDKGLVKEAPLSGTYRIFPLGCTGCYFNVFCDMATEGGGWTVVERRTGGEIDFYRGWDFYAMGFGQITGDHFLGLERIRMITNQKMMELQIHLVDIGDISTTAGYAHFSVGNASQRYPLRVSSYYGDAGDYLTASNNSHFSTFDQDNDGVLTLNCAQYFHAAWWYARPATPEIQCGTQSNLHGFYYLGRRDVHESAGPGVSWKPVPGSAAPAIKAIVWRVRPMGYTGSLRDLYKYAPPNEEAAAHDGGYGSATIKHE